MIILLADDEKLIRLSLKSMIEEIDPYIHNFIEARNGKELINIFKNNTPDLAFVDINMPFMDGLSAIEQCQNSFSNTRWFVLTGEKDFNLAKRAISIGVKDYLLKPISLKELTPIISDTKKSKYDLILKENNEFEFNVISIYNKLTADNNFNNYYLSLSNNETYIPYLFVIDNNFNFSISNYINQEILYKIRTFIIDKLDDNLRFATYYIDSQNLVLIIKSSTNININFDNLIHSLQDEYNSVSLLKYSSCQNLYECYKAVLELLNYSSIRAIEKFQDLNSIYEFRNSNDSYLLFCNYLVTLTCHYKNKEELLYNECLHNLKESLSIKKIYDSIDKKNLHDFLKITLGLSFDLTSNFKDLIDKLFKHSSSMFEKTYKVTNETLIDEIINYIKSNFMHQIGINTIAPLYNITPNYLSKIFKEKSGVKFTDYLTQVRINESKKLLSLNSLSLSEISLKVGYNSYRHFSKQFLKEEGITPSQFLKSQIFKSIL